MKTRSICTLVLTLGACAHARTADEYRADTAKVLVAKDPDVKACYDKVLAATPSASGLVTVDFAIEAKTGKVIDPKIDTSKTTAPKPVTQCVLDALNSVAIAPGDRKRGEATWTWQFNATPVSTTN